LDTKKMIIKEGIAYILISIFLIVLNIVYTHFSFGQSSSLMKNAYLITVIGGAIVLIFRFITRKSNKTHRAAFNLFNSGLAVLIAGFLCVAIITISGRDTDVLKYYLSVGVAFLLASFIQVFKDFSE